MTIIVCVEYSSRKEEGEKKNHLPPPHNHEHAYPCTYVDIHTAILYNYYTVYESGGMYMHVCKHVQRMNQEVMFIQTGLVLVPAHLVRMCTVLHCVCVCVCIVHSIVSKDMAHRRFDCSRPH